MKKKVFKFFSIFLIIFIFSSTFLSLQQIDQSVEEKIPPIWELYYKGEINQALGLAISLLSKSPEHPEINLIIGRIYVDLKQYSLALPYLEKAVKNDPNFTKIKSWGLAYQGVAYYMVNQIIEAKRVLQYCIDLNIDKDSIEYAKKRITIFGLTVFFEDWKNAYSNNFSIFVDPASNLDPNNSLNEAEKILNLIKKYILYENRKRICIYIWHNWELGPRIINENVPYENYVYFLSHVSFKESIARTIAKITLFNRYFPIEPITTPLIFEGFGYFIENINSDTIKDTKEIMNKLGINSISIKKLWQDWNSYSIYLRPSLSAAFIRHLIDAGGIAKFNELIKDMRYENAEKIYGSNLNSIISDFDKKISQ